MYRTTRQKRKRFDPLPKKAPKRQKRVLNRTESRHTWKRIQGFKLQNKQNGLPTSPITYNPIEQHALNMILEMHFLPLAISYLIGEYIEEDGIQLGFRLFKNRCKSENVPLLPFHGLFNRLRHCIQQLERNPKLCAFSWIIYPEGMNQTRVTWRRRDSHLQHIGDPNGYLGKDWVIPLSNRQFYINDNGEKRMWSPNELGFHIHFASTGSLQHIGGYALKSWLDQLYALFLYQYNRKEDVTVLFRFMK